MLRYAPWKLISSITTMALNSAWKYAQGREHWKHLVEETAIRSTSGRARDGDNDDDDDRRDELNPTELE